MPNNFQSRVNHVQPGSSVAAGNTGRPTRELESRTNYLKDLFDATEAGQLLVRRNQPLDSTVLSGEAVYWNEDNKRFEKALAGVENDADSGSLVATAAADAIGIVLSKESATSGTLGLLGMAQLTPAQLTILTGSSIAVPGRYYLSAVNAGQLVRQRPPVAVAMGYLLGPSDDCETNSWFLILPQPRDFLEDHIHFQYTLTARPAGLHIPPTTGEAHVITDANADLPGWLPADHAVFDSNAPAGAQFGYNLSAQEELNRNWPPIPVEAAVLELFKPDAVAQFQGGVRVMPEHVRMDRYGIWWMTDCYDEVPWPTDLDTSPASSSLSLSSESAAATCPLDQSMRLLLSFIKMTFTTQKTVVTSLAPDTDEPIEFVNCDGVAATTGDLLARLNVEALYDADEFFGGQALKEITDSSLKFGRGWVVEGVVTGSDELEITSTRQRGLDPDVAISSGNPAVHQGILTLSLQLEPTDRELNPQIIRLGDALQREYLNVDFIGFPTGRDSGIRMRYNIPPLGLPAIPRLKIRALVFGLATGPLPELTMQYRRITRPTEGSPTVLADTWTAMTFDVTTPSDDIDGIGTNLPAGQLIEVESEAITIAAGDTVLIELLRDAEATPAFAADVGVLRIGGITFLGA